MFDFMHYVQETIEIYVTNLCLSYRYICSINSTKFESFRHKSTGSEKKVKGGEYCSPPIALNHIKCQIAFSVSMSPVMLYQHLRFFFFLCIFPFLLPLMVYDRSPRRTPLLTASPLYNQRLFQKH